MEKTVEKISYKVYWYTWIWLLILTLVMIFIGYSQMIKGLKNALLLIGMLTKATFITGYFMHLKAEKLTLILIVAVGILLTASIFWGFTYVDEARILHLSTH